MKVFVVVADYGLNGSEVLGVFASRPADELARALVETPNPRSGYGPCSTTGYGGWEIVEQDVQP